MSIGKGSIEGIASLRRSLRVLPLHKSRDGDRQPAGSQ